MGMMDELKKMIHPYDDEDYDYEEDFEEPVRSPPPPLRSAGWMTAARSAAARIATTRW